MYFLFHEKLSIGILDQRRQSNDESVLVGCNLNLDKQIVSHVGFRQMAAVKASNQSMERELSF